MHNNSSDFGDEINSLKNIQNDFKESLSLELKEVKSLTQEFKSSIKGNLIAKLEADPSQSFAVSNYSQFSDNRWTFVKKDYHKQISVIFKSEIINGNQLKKMLVYFLMPSTNPLGTIKSFNTTVDYSRAIDVAEKYIFINNCLDATTAGIKAISGNLINEALDNARDNGSTKDYILLYFIINFWSALSDQCLIPQEYCLTISNRAIDHNFRQKDVQNIVKSTFRGWKSFNESELECLVKNALFWAQDCLPVLSEIMEFIESYGYEKKANKGINARHPLCGFEKVLGQKIDGATVCGFTVIIKNRKQKKYYIYRWLKPFKKATDRVSNALLILLALVTGMRISELSYIKFDDLIKCENGEYNLKITRYKTSDDPNYIGEVDEIPIPSLIGKLILDFKKLRDFYPLRKSPFLFFSNASISPPTIMTSSVRHSMRIFGREVGLDGIHPHRFRKTIAEILINRSESNIDLIRMLFGHKSYTMTLRYIARNPFLVMAVSETLKSNFTEAFSEIVSKVRNKNYSGEFAERIASLNKERPTLFKGTIFKITVYQYISNLLESGEPLFIQRTGLGTYCVSSEKYSRENLPPCIAKFPNNLEGDLLPDTTNCQLDCNKIVVVESARESIQKNILFYESFLKNAKLKNKQIKEISRKIKINVGVLEKLNASNLSQQNDGHKSHGR